MTRFIRKWTPAEVVNAIRAAVQLNQDLSYSRMRRHNPALLRAAEREFGTWGAAVEAAGIDYTTVRRYRLWTRERVIERIRELHAQGADLNWYMVLTKVDPPLAAAALHAGRFASWNEALHAAGLDPTRIARYQRWSMDAIQREIGRLMESGLPINRRILKKEAAPLLAAIDRFNGGLTGMRAHLELQPPSTRTQD